MNIDEYQTLACRTMGDASLTTLALGIAGESGEVADLVKKHVGHSHELDREKLKEELGDVLWYVATMARALGCELRDLFPSYSFESTTNCARKRALERAATGISASAGRVLILLNDSDGFSIGYEESQALERFLAQLVLSINDACKTIGVEIEDVAAANIDKLRRRYPDGFSSERSRNREE